MNPARGARSRAAGNVGVLAASLCALSAGEELWLAYVPAYLTALGASGAIVGLFASTKDLLDGVYQYPGGRLTDRAGRRRALLIFTACATAGYGIYAVAPGWPLMLVGLSAVMAWKAAAFPLTFSVVGESLPPERRATAFAIQSVMVRVPRVVSAPLGGLAIGAFGILAGFRLACAMTVAIALGVLLLQYRLFRDREPGPGARTSPRAGAGRRPMHPQLRRLLVADCLVRIGEGIAASFIVLFVTQVARRSAAEYGMLYAVQQAVAIAAYLPGARMVRFTGRRPVVALTFVFFAVFPLAVRHAGSDAGLFAAFLLGGLKELGEPARKSLIVDLSPDDRRASTIGTYYTIRNLLVVPAGLIGGLLWQQAPHLPLEAAAAVGLAGAALFLATGTDRSERA